MVDINSVLVGQAASRLGITRSEAAVMLDAARGETNEGDNRRQLRQVGIVPRPTSEGKPGWMVMEPVSTGD